MVFFILFFVWLISSSTICQPKTIHCEDGFVLYYAFLMGTVQECDTVLVEYDFYFTKNCLDQFNIPPILQIITNSTLTLEKNVFTNDGGVRIFSNIRAEIRGVENIDELHLFFIDENAIAVFLDDLIVTSALTIGEKQTIEFDSNLILKDHSKLYVKTNGKLIASKLYLTEHSDWIVDEIGEVEIMQSVVLSDVSSIQIAADFHFKRKENKINVLLFDSSHIYFNNISTLIVDGDMILRDKSILGFIGNVQPIKNYKVNTLQVNNLILYENSLVEMRGILSCISVTMNDNTSFMVHESSIIKTITFVQNDLSILLTKLVDKSTKRILVSGGIKMYGNANCIITIPIFRINSLTMDGNSAIRLVYVNEMHCNGIVLNGNSTINVEGFSAFDFSSLRMFNGSSMNFVGNMSKPVFSSFISPPQMYDDSSLNMKRSGLALISFVPTNRVKNFILRNNAKINMVRSWINSYYKMQFYDHSLLFMSTSNIQLINKISFYNFTTIQLRRYSYIDNFLYQPPGECPDYGDCSVVYVSNNVTIDVENLSLPAPAPFSVNGGYVHIEEDVKIIQTTDECFDLVYSGIENEGYVKYPKEKFIGIHHSMIIRKCPKQPQYIIFCEMIGKQIGNSLDGFVYYFVKCPCSNWEEQVYLIADGDYDNVIKIGTGPVDVEFVSQPVKIEVFFSYGDIQTIIGVIKSITFPYNISVVGMSSKSYLSKDINNIYYLNGNYIGEFCDETCFTQHLFIDDLQLNLNNDTNYQFYLENGTKAFHLLYSNITSQIFFMAKYGIMVGNNASTLCEYMLLDTTGAYCLRKKVLECPEEYYLNENKNECLKCGDNCFYCSKESYCDICKTGFKSNAGKCEEVKEEECFLFDKEHCVQCSNGNVYNGKCSSEVIHPHCLMFYENECILCDYLNGYYLSENNTCIKDDYYSIISSNSIVSCQQQFYNNQSKCMRCPKNCLSCCFSGCSWCEDGYFLSKEGKCENNHCLSNSQMAGCHECEENYVITETGFCLMPIQNCVYRLNDRCLECESGYNLQDGKCFSEMPPHCIKTSSIGCIVCEDGFYATRGYCKECNKICTTCAVDSSRCTKCSNGTFVDPLTLNCISNIDLNEKCVDIISRGKCTSCKNGYYLDALRCLPCDISCGICNNPTTCITCNSTNFMKETTCLPQSSIVGCKSPIDIKKGCTKCQDGYYHYQKECGKCPRECATCENSMCCLTCTKDYILMKNNSCIHISEVKHCLISENSKCVKCEENYKPGESETYCEYYMHTWDIVLIIFGVLLFVIIFISYGICVSLFVFRIIEHQRRKKMFHLFRIDESDIQFKKLNKLLVCDKEVLKFEKTIVISEEINENIPLLRPKSIETIIQNVPVNKESVESIFIGNEGKQVVKIQLLKKIGNKKSRIRTEPEVVTLKPNQACEFKIFIKPLCTCKIHEEIKVVSMNIKTNEEHFGTIKIETETELSSFIDPDEIKEERQIGQGTFGIVYLGTFRGNKVAIKKMRGNYSEKEKMDEFNKEVTMLDKFRSEYIIHFHGAVIIPNKICVITEFAQHGSIQNLMIMSYNSPVEMGMRIKILLDAAKGIQYLHSNGILHRDIKPDNILVLSLEGNIKVNAKLTDFGSSRNINLLMTNMTFTKGIGTPIYMAPEILNQDHYKKAADIFSFAITMYSVLQWKDPYNPEQLRAWDIADRVCNGLRPSLDSIPNELRTLIENSWTQIPQSRSRIEVIVKDLSYLYDQIMLI